MSIDDLYHPNELREELLGLTAINPFCAQNSGSRSVMFSSHMSQKLVIKGVEEKRVTSGVETEFAKHTFSIKMPESGRIIQVIERYPQGVGKDAIPYNPDTYVFYERDDTKEIDFFLIKSYECHHQHFGFDYKFKDTMADIRPNAYIAKDTIFADSPCVGENGSYMFGTNMNVAFMSLPAVTEDGIIVSSDVLDKLTFSVYETRAVDVGAHAFPRNLFGTPDHYKPFMDIGEELREDGLLMVLADYEKDLYPVETSIYDTMECDYTFDRSVYVRGGRGRIVDIKVIANNVKSKRMPTIIASSFDKYERALRKFHQEVLDLERSLRADYRKKYKNDVMRVTPKLHRLLVESLVITNHTTQYLDQTLNLLYRKTTLDEYRIEFVIKYDIVPDIGYKMTCTSGGKGVICKIESPENMPVDADGNRADVIMYGGSGPARMIPGRHYEHYIAGAARDVSKLIRRQLGYPETPVVKIPRTSIESLDPDTLSTGLATLKRFYQITSEKQHEFFISISDEERLDELCAVVNKGIYSFMPVSNKRYYPMIIKNLENEFYPTYGPVTYVGNSGKKRTTKRNVRIAPLYMILLEKIADTWLSVASANLHPLGVPAPVVKSEKNSLPYKPNPCKTLSETEVRIVASYLDPNALAELMDINNNPQTMRMIAHQLLTADNPTNIDKIVDREIIPLGGNKPLALVRHMLKNAGFDFSYVPEVE